MARLGRFEIKTRYINKLPASVLKTYLNPNYSVQTEKINFGSMKRSKVIRNKKLTIDERKSIF
jgi:hypothetical protein